MVDEARDRIDDEVLQIKGAVYVLDQVQDR
jgi:hypothetical protein